jgi:hypothetical protein
MNMRSKLLAFAIAILCGGNALAHDGGFGHSRRAIFVSAGPGEFILEYRITLSPDEALLQMAQIDRDGDAKISTAEKNQYFLDAAQKLAERLDCKSMNGNPIRPLPAGFELGQALTQRFRFRLSTDNPDWLLTDNAFGHKPGVVRVVTGDSVKAQVAEKTDMTHVERVTIQFSRTDRGSSGDAEPGK